MKTRICSLLLAVVLLCTLLPQITLPTEAGRISSGTCGEDLTWSFDSASGVLTIEGSGEMEDYYLKVDSPSPWANLSSLITAVCLPDGLTHIGSYAFEGCAGLTEISFPKQIRTIGEGAFVECSGLTAITLPEQLSCIQRAAFDSCTGLKKISFPEGLTSIEGDAFHECSALTELSLPNEITSIGYCAFQGCSALSAVKLPDKLSYLNYGAFANCTAIESFSISDSNQFFSTDDYGVLFNKDKTTLLQYPCARAGAYEIPASVCEIEMMAFDIAKSLTAFSVAAGNTEFSADASGVLFNADQSKLIFYPCGRAGAYAIPEGVKSIWTFAFEEASGLTELKFPASFTEFDTFYNMDYFRGCTALTDFSVAEGNQDFTAVDGVLFNADQSELIFYPCGKAGAYTLPEGCAVRPLAFSNCAKLTKLIFPKSFALDDMMYEENDYRYKALTFRGCTALSEFAVAEGNQDLTAVDGVLFNADQSELVFYPFGKVGAYEVPKSVRSFYPGAFDSCPGLTSVSLPEGITEIDEYLFFSCTGLEEVKLSEGLISIGDGSFSSCSKLSKITLPESLTTIESGAFYDCIGLTEITLPAAVTKIEKRAFENCKSLRRLILRGDQTYINTYTHGYDSDENLIMPNINEEIFGSTAVVTIFGQRNPDLPRAKISKDFPDADSNDESAYLYLPCYADEIGYPFYELDVFSDVEHNRFYELPVAWAFGEKITTGTNASQFSPNAPCTRAQVVTFLHRAMGEPEPESTEHPFTDVTEGSFYHKAMLWAYENGITKGVNESQFGPDSACTRAQVVTFLYRTMGEPEPESAEHPFEDVNEEAFYYKAMLWAYENGITKGVKERQFGPDSACTRGQVVTFLYNLLGQ